MGRIVDYNLTEELAHGIYVSCLAREVAKELDLDGDVQQNISLAGLLHDIGKLTLANYLYGEEQLESPLVIEEMKYVRMHSMKSYEILKRMGYSDSICDTVRYHHENYDGSGYPDNLSGEAIPLSSRIIRVCDVFAALTSDRPYRKKFTEEEAIALMIEEINHFDMRVFLAFLRVVHRVGTSYRVSFPDVDEVLLGEAGLEDHENFASDAGNGKVPAIMHEADKETFPASGPVTGKAAERLSAEPDQGIGSFFRRAEKTGEKADGTDAQKDA